MFPAEVNSLLCSALTGVFGLQDDDDGCGLTESGSTAVTCLMIGKDLYCANAGDSRAVLCRKGTAVGLSEDHKPCNDEEKARIEKAGGFVEDKRVNGTLAVARAMGDFSFKTETQLSAEEQQVTMLPTLKC
jgi:serine/threonine protein phosphatase PrpC